MFRAQYVSAPLVVNGTSNGILTVPTTLPFVAGATVYLSGTALNTLELRVEKILNPTQLTVRFSTEYYDAVTGTTGKLVNASAYTTAAAATLVQNEQEVEKKLYEHYLTERLDAIYNQILSGNQRKRFVQSIAFTTATVFTTLNTVTADQFPIAIPSDAIWVFQPDADCQYATSNTAWAVTNTNSVWVPASNQDWTRLSAGDLGVNLKGRTASGNMQVFVVF